MKDALENTHAIVTGASRGIGKATSERLAALGADVTLVARTASKLEANCSELQETYGGSYVAAPADVTDRQTVEAAFEQARETLGPVGVLVNNVGAAESAPFATMEPETWHRMIELNLDTVYYCTRQVLPEMLEEGSGRVVNNASTSGLNGYKYVSAYSAAKHAVVGLTKSVAKEVAGSGVTINAVCPGYTDTAMVEEGAAEAAAGTDKSPEQIKEAFKRMNPQGRFVQPEEVASTIAWLCRPEQRSINGAALPIDGGETA